MTEQYEHVITIRGLVNRFGSQAVHDGLELDVRRDEILGVVGGSGTGKSVQLVEYTQGSRGSPPRFEPRYHAFCQRLSKNEGGDGES